MERTITTSNGLSIVVDDDGNRDGDVVLLLHGFPDTADLWRHQIEPLTASGYRVLVPDQRGYGRSSKPAEVSSYTISELVSDVIAILDACAVPRVHLVGHDWGANVAWATATFFPDRVASLAAFSVGHPTAFAAAGAAQQVKIWYTLLFQFDGVAEEWLVKEDGANFKGWFAHPEASRVLRHLERDGSLRTGIHWYRANLKPSQWNAPPPKLPNISVPTLGVWSTNDHALTEAQMVNSADYVDNRFTYKRIEGAGHWLPVERPDEVTAVLLEHLGEVGG
jgi:pimeloyl-ACP methyl ester carboxylesterase